MAKTIATAAGRPMQALTSTHVAAALEAAVIEAAERHIDLLAAEGRIVPTPAQSVADAAIADAAAAHLRHRGIADGGSLTFHALDAEQRVRTWEATPGIKRLLGRILLHRDTAGCVRREAVGVDPSAGGGDYQCIGALRACGILEPAREVDRGLLRLRRGIITVPCSREDAGEGDERVTEVLLAAVAVAGSSMLARLGRLHDREGVLYVASYGALLGTDHAALRLAWDAVGCEPRGNVVFVDVSDGFGGWSHTARPVKPADPRTDIFARMEQEAVRRGRPRRKLAPLSQTRAAV